MLAKEKLKVTSFIDFSVICLILGIDVILPIILIPCIINKKKYDLNKIAVMMKHFNA